MPDFSVHLYIYRNVCALESRMPRYKNPLPRTSFLKIMARFILQLVRQCNHLAGTLVDNSCFTHRCQKASEPHIEVWQNLYPVHHKSYIVTRIVLVE